MGECSITFQYLTDIRRRHSTALQQQCTCEAPEADLQVSLQLLETRTRVFQLSVGHTYLAGHSSGTSSVSRSQDVRVAPDVAHVDLDALAQAHPTVKCLVNHDDLRLRAAGPEYLRVAICGAWSWHR